MMEQSQIIWDAMLTPLNIRKNYLYTSNVTQYCDMVKIRIKQLPFIVIQMSEDLVWALHRN